MIDEKQTRIIRGNVMRLYEIQYKSWGKRDICGIWADCLLTAEHALRTLQAYDENMQAICKHTVSNVIGTGYVHGITFSNAMETQNGTYLPISIGEVHNINLIPDVYQITDILDTGKLTGNTI